MKLAFGVFPDVNQISDHPLELPALIFVLAVMEIRAGVD